ncbi:hypothetical protein Peur_071102 [Populus x canadensis]
MGKVGLIKMVTWEQLFGVPLQIPLVYISTLVFGLVYSGEESPNILSVKYAFSLGFYGHYGTQGTCCFQVLKELDSDDIKTMEISLISGQVRRHQQMAHGRDQLLIIGSGIYEPAQP